MSRLVNLLFALLLIAALVIAFDPGARQRAVEAFRDLEPALEQLDDRIIVNIPSFGGPDISATPVPTPTPFPTAVVDDDVQIPVTGDEDSSDEPIIQINWDALADSLKGLWERLKSVEIDLNPGDGR